MRELTNQWHVRTSVCHMLV